MKDMSLEVVKNGGIVRGVQNHGIRQLPHRFKAKFPDKAGNRYFEHGRFVSMYYDTSPKTMREVENILRKDDHVLRQTHLRLKNKMDYVNYGREDKNPYVQRALAMEKQEAAEAEIRSEAEAQHKKMEASLQFTPM
jgi:ribosomal protein S6